MKRYVVYWVGGIRDGETLLTCDDERRAVNFAERFSTEHEKEFDPLCGGVSVEDDSGNIVW